MKVYFYPDKYQNNNGGKGILKIWDLFSFVRYCLKNILYVIHVFLFFGIFMLVAYLIYCQAPFYLKWLGALYSVLVVYFIQTQNLFYC